MRKKTKFPLEMPNGSLVRELEELQENFDLEAVTKYFANGQLQLWLQNNYNEYILEEINNLTGKEPDFVEKLTATLGVHYDNQKIDVEDTISRSNLENELGRILPEEELNRIINYVADNQVMLDKLIEKGEKDIYLYKNKFYIDDRVEDIYFHGLENPELIVKNYNENEFFKKRIKFKDVKVFDENGNKIQLENYFILINNLLDICEDMLKRGMK